MLNLWTVNTRLFKVCFSYLLGISYSRCASQFLEISSSTVTCAVTEKRENRSGGFGLEVPCQYSFKGNSLVVNWKSGRSTKERKKDSSGCFGQEPRKKNRQHRGSSKGITVGKAVVQLQNPGGYFGFIRRGSAPRSDPLPFYIPFWQKRYPFYILLIEKRYPFTYLV